MFWSQQRKQRPRRPHRLIDVGDISVAILARPAGRFPAARVMTYRALLVYDDGEYREHGGELARLLDGEEMGRLHAFLDDLRRTARERMIPGPRGPRR
mgnify:CR=1 FL=1